VIDEKRIAAIIPARANSTGLPGKNYKEILGKPLIQWSIDAARQSKYIDDIVVSSNCEECLDIAHKNDTLIVKRPEELCMPLSSTDDTLRHAVEIIKKEYKLKPDYIVLLQPTSPARRENIVDDCIAAVPCVSGDSALTVSSHTPFFWTKRGEFGTPMHDPNHRPMRQELSDMRDFYMHDDGNVCVVETAKLRSMGRVGTKTVLIKNKSFNSMQIDTEDDFRIMKAIGLEFGGFL